MKKTGMLVLASATLVVLGACKNGGNNVRDTSGMSAGSAPAATTPPPDTTRMDTTKKGTKNP
jgi:hypothetical protein